MQAELEPAKQEAVEALLRRGLKNPMRAIPTSLSNEEYEKITAARALARDKGDYLPVQGLTYKGNQLFAAPDAMLYIEKPTTSPLIIGGIIAGVLLVMYFKKK